MASLLYPRTPFDSSMRSRVKIDIRLHDLDGHNSVPTYTTLDTIRGDVVFTADVDTRFDQVSISFTGTSRTQIETPGVAAPTVGTSSAFHTFLRLSQPIEESDYPQPRVLEAGRSYTFPFTFVVPDQLLPYACNHDVLHPQIKANHTRLPPSLGDPMVAGDGSTLLDDMAPEMVQIQYGVRVKISKINPTDGKMQTLLERGKKVRIIPATEEQPPLDVLDGNQEYRMRKEKDVKKGALRGKLGCLVMTAAQPKPFHLPPLHASSNSEQQPATTTATVHLRFDPVDEKQQPPRLGTLWTKLKAHTWYATEPWTDTPARSNNLAWCHDRGVYTQTICLACRCIGSATWQKHTGSTPNPSPSASTASSRRGSIQSDCSATSDSSLSSSSSSSYYSPYAASASYAGKTYYTTSLIVPVTLPKNKAFVPTFHTCLSARTYALDLSLSYHTPSASLTAPLISIRIPVQIMGPGTLPDSANIYAISEQLGEEFFTPRTIMVPRPEYTGRANLLRQQRSRAGEEHSTQEDSLERSTTRASAISRSSVATYATPPPDYSEFARRVSTRRAVTGAC
ncbi:hypothetical protein VTO42DRAFT_6129 [Malbranchea cinnamomea]